MSSDSEDLSFDSDSSSISSNSIEYHEWESRVVQYNQRTDRILEDVIINYPSLVIQDQPSRARQVYRDRERKQGEALLMADYFEWLFAQHQEAVRKDVERAFGVLQARFAFLRRPCLIWDYEQMGQIMNACIIMHNMIVEDERETYQNFDPSEFFNDMHTPGNEVVEYSTERIADLRSYMRNREQLRNREAHSSLKNDLIEHI
ncbi:putative harbinger transposase-derived protein [Tanacetum coccineum]